MYRNLLFRSTGNPPSVVELGEADVAAPSTGELEVRVLAAPINPADINFIEGKYGIKPVLPSALGFEGLGEVVRTGADCGDWSAGDRLLLPGGPGSWAERQIVAAKDCVRIANDLPIEQAAMLRVNPPTAWRMLHDFVKLEAGDWIAINAANSGVGLAVIAIARSAGWRTACLVRGEERVSELKAAGADLVVVEGDGVEKQLAEAMGGAVARLALNAVGGESALRLAKLLAPGGVHVTYGAMGRQPLKIPNGLLIFNDLSFRGFWVSKWFKAATPEAIRQMFDALSELVRAGKLYVPVEQVYSLEEHAAALERAMESGRRGKILFRPD